MNRLRDAIVNTLKAKFPSMAQTIVPFHGLLTEQTEKQISYNSPGIMVCILGADQPDDTIAPWELAANVGLVVTVKAASAIERDKAGWDLCTQVANIVYANTWGVEQQNIRPAIITLLRKNEQRDLEGTPTGQAYWTIQFFNFIKFEALLNDE